MLHTVIGLIGAGLAWLAWEFASDALGEVFWWATGPIRRPIWRAFVTASWPWPMLVQMFVGAAAAYVGLTQLNPELPRWRGASGVVAFLGGCGIALVAPLVWRDARRQRADESSRPAV